MDENALKNEIQELINKYNKIAEEKKIKRYNEEMTKKDFILPLFEILGWNVYNKSNRNDNVSAEEKISKKRVDYGFRINDIPKFFLEAKALREDLDNPKFIEQAINYAWYKGCTWAVLTDFEQVKIFNAEWKTTHPIHNLLKSIACYEFIDRFDELWLLSKESFERGLLDREAEKWGKKTKKTPVDKQLLSDFTRFRELLSKNITKLNQDKHVTEEELDESVQRILDRLIFIRNCEDRGLEEKKLWESKNEIKVLKKLREIFTYYDENYNSKLFTYDPNDSKKIHLCDTLIIDNEILKEIIKSLYQTKDKSFSYDFSAIEADVLGNIYEQYLGHVLKKSEKRAKLTNGKTHRKEQGIYYTPTYIVDYIVRDTLGKLLKKKKIDADKIRVLDSACGSGSFLIKAFDLLNEYWKKKDKLYTQARFDTTGEGITFTRKVKILENNIFGVDLDKQAVEIAQLNLLLKIAEKGHRLPLLQQNIKCGNTLIDDEKVIGDKALDFEKEFSDITLEGGFDVVIGNPPYVRHEELTSIKHSLESYEIYNGSNDIYAYFFEKGLKLLKNGGLFGFIVSSKFMKTRYGKKLRQFILKNTKILQIIDFADLPIFTDATTYPCIIILEKSWDNLLINKKNKITITKIHSLDFSSLEEVRKNSSFKINQSSLSDTPWFFEKKEGLSIKNKIEKNGIPLIEFINGKLYRGITTGCNDAFIIDEDIKNNIIKKDKKCSDLIKPFLTGKDIKRYSIGFKNRYLIYTYTGVNIDKFPAIKEHLLQYKEKLDKVWEVKHDKHPWYELRGCSYYDEFCKNKIIYPRINIRPNFTLDDKGYFTQDSSFIMPSSCKYLLGVLNSKLMQYYVRFVCSLLRGGYYDYRYQYVETFPIVRTNKKIEEKMDNFVEKLLVLNKRVKGFGDKQTDERTRIKEEITKIEREIDKLVYKLYGLTKEEIANVEESMKT